MKTESDAVDAVWRWTSSGKDRLCYVMFIYLKKEKKKARQDQNIDKTHPINLLTVLFVAPLQEMQKTEVRKPDIQKLFTNGSTVSPEETASHANSEGKSCVKQLW